MSETTAKRHDEYIYSLERTILSHSREGQIVTLYGKIVASQEYMDEELGRRVIAGDIAFGGEMVRFLIESPEMYEAFCGSTLGMATITGKVRHSVQHLDMKVDDLLVLSFRLS